MYVRTLAIQYVCNATCTHRCMHAQIETAELFDYNNYPSSLIDSHTVDVVLINY